MLIPSEHRTPTQTVKPAPLVGGYGNMAPQKTASVELRGGNFFDVFNPDFSILTPEIMAHALSNQCRFSGHTDRHYSVAEHSVFVSLMAEAQAWDQGLELEEIEVVAKQGLLHDGSEGPLQDVASPIKRELPQYKVIEAPIQAGIFKQHGLPTEMHHLVHAADMRMALTEKIAFLGPEGLNRPEWAPLSDHYDPYRYSFAPQWLDRLLTGGAADEYLTVYFAKRMTPERAKKLWLKRYADLFA